MISTEHTFTEKDFETQFDAEHRFCFIETEDAVIVAAGDTDIQKVIDDLLVFDKLCTDEEAERARAEDFTKRWVIPIYHDESDEWWFSWELLPDVPVIESTPGAFSVWVWAR